MDSRLTLLIRSLASKLGLIFSISLGVFLFILFFQPFPYEDFDFNNKLLFVAGFGAIVFLFIVVIRVTLPWIIRKNGEGIYDTLFTSLLGDFAILVLSSVAFVFYLRYVGSVKMSFIIVFKVVMICLVPPVILRLFDLYKSLIRQNVSLDDEMKTMQKQIEKFEEDNLNRSLEFISENSNETLTLSVAEVVFFQSADNYVDIAYFEGDVLKKKLLRNTLKNIELQIKQYPNFIRCHRTCIVNKQYIEKLKQDYTNHWIMLKGCEEKIPVSRQYILKLKEAL